MKALFLDRDGIINVDHGYVYQKESFEFTEGIFELLHLFIKHKYILFIVTNQSGIGRGYYSQEAFLILSKWMTEIFQKNGIKIQSVHYCPHSPEEHCTCRKPNIGMIEDILSSYDIDLQHSWMIGDKQSDIDMASNAHIASTIAIGSRKIEKCTYHFNSIMECKAFLEENQDTIL